MGWRKDLDLLRAGTDDPDLAKNWHMRAMPGIDQGIAERKKLIADLKEAGPELNEQAEEFAKELEEAQGALELFLERWPRPVREVLDDRNEPIEIPSDWYRIELTQSLPKRPMTLRTPDSKWTGTLFWQDDDGTVYRVPNVHYNRIVRTVNRWDPVYEQALAEEGSVTSGFTDNAKAVFSAGRRMTR